jgi:hypothetical protein
MSNRKALGLMFLILIVVWTLTLGLDYMGVQHVMKLCSVPFSFLLRKGFFDKSPYD